MSKTLISSLVIFMSLTATAAPIYFGGRIDDEPVDNTPKSHYVSSVQGRDQACRDLLRSLDGQGVSKDAKLRGDVAMAMLALILEHPVFLRAIEMKDTSEKDLLRLFHLSGGFVLPPGFARKNLLGQDRTGYPDMVSMPLKKMRPDGRVNVNVAILFNEFLRDPTVRPLVYSDRLAADVYGLLFDAFTYQWSTFGDNAGATSADQTVLPQGHKQKMFAPSDDTLYGDYSVRLKGFKGLPYAGVSDLNSLGRSLTTQKIRYEGARKLAVEFMMVYFPRIMALRDHILSVALGEAKDMRQAMRFFSAEREALRREIFEFSAGKNPKTQIMERPAPPVQLQLQPEVAPKKWDVSALDEILTEWENPQSDLMKLPRRSLQAMDGVVSQPVSYVNMESLRQQMPKALQSADQIPKVTAYLGTLTEKIEADLDNMDALITRLHRMADKANADFVSLAAQLENSGMAPARQAAKLDEANLLQVTMAQSLLSLNSQYGRKLGWTSVLVQLQALLRSYREHEALGDDVEKLAKDIMEVVHQLLGPEPAKLLKAPETESRRSFGGPLIVL